MARKTVEVETTGQAYLELLRERGIDYFFANSGTDFAPLIDAFARFAEQGKQTPKPITVPHENAAVAMAHGYYMVTGKPQVVMVHVTVGTANALNGIINAARDHVPILFSAVVALNQSWARELRNQVGPADWLDLILEGCRQLRRGRPPLWWLAASAVVVLWSMIQISLKLWMLSASWSSSTRTTSPPKMSRSSSSRPR